MTVFIQLTGVGTDSGPYSLFYDVNPTPFIVGVSRATLIAGANYTIPDGSYSITVRSTGVCPDVITLPIISPPTTTTTTTTGIPCYTYTLSTTAPTFAFDYNFIDCAGEYTASSLSGEGNTTDICARVDTVTISSGDGNSVIGSVCSAPPTTTSTTTTTTTSIPYWYILTGCADSLTYYAGPFTGPQVYSIGERVEGATSVFYVVTVTTTVDPGPVLSGISSTGFFGCPP